MKRSDVEKIISEYLKPIFGFALKRCKSIHDAEDLSQEIMLRAFRALLVKEDVADVGKFIWTVAHNTLSNYYCDAAKNVIGVSIGEVAELLVDPCSEIGADDNTEAIQRLCAEIAYPGAKTPDEFFRSTLSQNIIISSPTAELLTMQNEMYKRAAALFANDLYDELISSGILDDPGIRCDQNDEEVATIRPDGAHNIYHASVVPDEMALPEDYVYTNNWCGPAWYWNSNSSRVLWRFDSEWSGQRVNSSARYSDEAKLALFPPAPGRPVLLTSGRPHA